MRDPSARISFPATSDRRQTNVRRQSIASNVPPPPARSSSNTDVQTTDSMSPSSSSSNSGEPPKRRGSFLSRIFRYNILYIMHSFFFFSKEGKKDKKDEKPLQKSSSKDAVKETEEMPHVESKVFISNGVGCVVNTFGYGSDHDANMLRAISDAGDGTI